MEQSRRNAGIVDFACYIPSLYVKLGDLEQFDEVSAGKYTIGLGQKGMAVCTDREDVQSLCLTVVDRLIRRAKISHKDIGRLEVGTESLTDKSKSVKTVLMQLFAESGNFSVEGADNLNACYGGTAGLFNTIDWVESPAWDGRYGIVVMADIAVYKEKAARPTGGAGAVAFLIGADAPIILESGCRATTAQHHYDFYKPVFHSSYPMVDGMLSIQCYLESMVKSYKTFKEKHIKRKEKLALNEFSSIVFHSPFCALVTKAYALLCATDEVSQHGSLLDDSNKVLYTAEDLLKFSTDKPMQKALMARYADRYKAQTQPSLLFSRNLGNSYTAAVYFCLLCGLASCAKLTPVELIDRKVLMYSYGSGSISSIFAFRMTKDTAKKLVDQAAADTAESVLENNRISISPEQMCKVHKCNEQMTAPYTPRFPEELLPGDCYYLKSIDDKYRRIYEKSSNQVTPKPDDVRTFIDSL